MPRCGGASARFSPELLSTFCTGTAAAGNMAIIGEGDRPAKTGVLLRWLKSWSRMAISAARPEMIPQLRR